MLESRTTLWLVAALAALLTCVTNYPWHLDELDQAKQAYVPFEMVNEGHWFYQHTPNDKIATKPPLVGWVSAAVYGVTRTWQLAWRLPPFAAAAAIGWLLTRAARAAYGTSAALLGFAAFALNVFTLRIATLVRTDMPLALVIFLLGLQIWWKIRSREPWTSRDRLIAFALLTAGTLIKGPIVYGFLLPAIIAFEFIRRRRSGLTSAWCGWRPWLGSLAVFLLWVEIGMVYVPNFYEETVLKEFLGRFSETVHHTQPFYFYIPHLLHKFAPWSLLAIGLAIALRRTRMSAESLWLICAATGGLVLMSLIPSKRLDRIFPIIPPLCLWLAAMYSARPVRFWAQASLVFAALFCIGYTAFRVHTNIREDDAGLMRFADAVQRETAQHGWRYDVVDSHAEGLIIYLRRLHFTLPEIAIERWKRGETDAVVISLGKTSIVKPEYFPGAVPTGIEGSTLMSRQVVRYALLKRAP